MPFEHKNQYLFSQQQAYNMMKDFNKSLRDKEISNENQLGQFKAEMPRTAEKQSGFCK